MWSEFGELCTFVFVRFIATVKILNKNDDRCWYPKQNLSVRPQPLPAGPVVVSRASSSSVVWLFPTVSPYNSSSVPGWMSRHTRRHTSTHLPTHTSPQAHCTATFCWAPLRTWQANLGGKKHKYKQREGRYTESKRVALHVYVYLISMQFRVFVFHRMRRVSWEWCHFSSLWVRDYRDLQHKRPSQFIKCMWRSYMIITMQLLWFVTGDLVAAKLLFPLSQRGNEVSFEPGHNTVQQPGAGESVGRT